MRVTAGALCLIQCSCVEVSVSLKVFCIDDILSFVPVCERLEMWCARILKVLDIASVCDITHVSAILYLFKV